uniref:Ig-like domain-containing protein n=1 Tax=Sinocyclocheilus anshuiensis TaxID=1608454 RepID=A0A671RLA0_9TELE
IMQCKALSITTVLLLLSPVSLQDPVHITGVVGGSVILPCSYKERVLKPVEINVFWRYNESMVVYDIENGIPSTKGQDAMFKVRIESFTSEYENGNFSIRLQHLNFTDSGQFSCSIIPHEGEEHKEHKLVKNVKTEFSSKELWQKVSF